MATGKKQAKEGAKVKVTIPYDELINFKKIGYGSFSIVYKVRHASWGCEVVYKRLKMDFLDPEEYKEESKKINGLKKEAAIHVNLRHSNIVMMMGIIFDEKINQYGLVLELVQHGSLASFLKKISTADSNSLPWLLKTKMAHEIASGMAYLHGLKPSPIIHGDLKTQNVLVTEHFNAKIADFGLSQWNEYVSSCSSVSKTSGTMVNIPPEKWKELKLSANEKYDVYGFSILLWELYTNSSAFEDLARAGQSAEVQFLPLKIEAGTRPSMEKMPRDVPSAIADLIHQCWCQEPGERPNFSEDIITTLGSFVCGVLPENEIQRAKLHLHRTLECSTVETVALAKKPEEVQTPRHIEKITRVYQQLVDSLRRTDLILTTLLQKKFLSPREYEVIRIQPCTHETVQQLLDVLLNKPYEAYVCFRSALESTKQEHLYRLLEEKDFNLNVDHRAILLGKYQELKDNIHLTGSKLLSSLEQNEVLDSQEVADVKAKPTEHQKIEQLLSLLLRTSADQYDVFIRLLPCADHRHVYDIFSNVVSAPVEVSGIPKDVGAELLSLFLEDKRRCWGGDIVSLKHNAANGTAVVQFKERQVAEALLAKEAVKYSDGTMLYIRPVPQPSQASRASMNIASGDSQPVEVATRSKSESKESTTVEVTGLNTTMTVDFLKLLFENKRSEGGPLKTLQRSSPEKAIVVFQQAKDNDADEAGNRSPIQIVYVPGAARSPRAVCKGDAVTVGSGPPGSDTSRKYSGGPYGGGPGQDRDDFPPPPPGTQPPGGTRGPGGQYGASQPYGGSQGPRQWERMSTPSSFFLEPASATQRPSPFPPRFLKRQIYNEPSVFKLIDEHAINEARTDYRNFKDLMWNLIFKKHWNELEKARAIFRWMTTKNLYTIMFDSELPGSPEQVLGSFKDNKTTMAKIFECLANFAGLHCVTLSGWAKGVEYKPGMPITSTPPNHSWNTVFIDGNWQLVDSHWATRYLQSERNTPENLVYEYDDFYFLAEPSMLIYSHCPEEPAWQLLHPARGRKEYEDYPLVKSYFFSIGMQFLQQNRGIVFTKRGIVTLTLGFTQPTAFTFKLGYGDNSAENLQGIQLKRYVIQETTDNRVTFYFRSPREGSYYMTMFAQPVADRVKVENVFKAACEYKIICDQAASDIRPFPLCSDANWGAGAPVRQYGITPSQKTALLAAPNGRAEVSFARTRDVRLHARLVKDGMDEETLESAVAVREQDDMAYVTVHLPTAGEYGLEVYANEPQREGDTYTHMCQYLVSFTDRDFANLYGQVFDRSDLAYAMQATPGIYNAPGGQ